MYTRRRTHKIPGATFNSRGQIIYSILQTTFALGVIALAIGQLLIHELQLKKIFAYLEILGGISYMATGVFGFCSARTEKLSYTLATFVFCSFSIFCSTVNGLMYPISLLVDPGDVNSTGYWLGLALLAAAFFIAVAEWCVALCQAVVCYRALLFMVRQGHEGFSDPRHDRGYMFEASLDPSEETMLLAGRYSAQMCYSQSSEQCQPRTIQTTALITPSAPPQR